MFQTSTVAGIHRRVPRDHAVSRAERRSARAGQFALVGALVLSGCSGGKSTAPGVSGSRGTAAASAAPTVSAGPTLILRTVRIALDGTPTAPGRLLARIRIGSAIDELGLLPTQHDLNPLLPSAFVMDRSGLWVLDPVKHRIARFDLTGHYLGQVSGVSDIADDIAPLPDGRLLVSDDPSDRTRLRVLTPGPNRGLPATLSGPIDISHEDRDGQIDAMFRLAWAQGVTGVWMGSGFFPLSPTFAVQRDVEGLPLPTGGLLRVSTANNVDWTFTDGGVEWNVTFTSGKDPNIVAVVISLQQTSDALYLWTMHGPASPTPRAQWDLSPRVLVVLPRNGPPRTVAVHDSNANLEDSNLHRNFNVTPDGRVIQMVVSTKDVLFRKVPN